MFYSAGSHNKPAYYNMATNMYVKSFFSTRTCNEFAYYTEATYNVFCTVTCDKLAYYKMAKITYVKSLIEVRVKQHIRSPFP